MKVKLSNSIINVRFATQAICIPDEKSINIIDIECDYAMTIYPVTSEDLKKDYNKIVKAIESAVNEWNEKLNKNQEATGN
jgi:hypothetical protein